MEENGSRRSLQNTLRASESFNSRVSVGFRASLSPGFSWVWLIDLAKDLDLSRSRLRQKNAVGAFRSRNWRQEERKKGSMAKRACVISQAQCRCSSEDQQISRHKLKMSRRNRLCQMRISDGAKRYEGLSRIQMVTVHLLKNYFLMTPCWLSKGNYHCFCILFFQRDEKAHGDS